VTPGEASAPPQLAAVQALLKDAFRLGTPIPEDAGLASRVSAHVSGNDRFSPAEQADIYRRQYFLRHVDSLIEDHPGLVHYLGDDGFEQLANAYLEKHPPTSYTLRDLGADLATFLATYDGVPEDMRELLCDLARYDLHVVELFDAADVPPPDAERLRALPEDAWLTRPLVFNPQLRLHAFGYPAPEIRNAIRDGEHSKEPPPREPPPREPTRYGIFRRDHVVSFERLSPQAFELLSLLKAGVPLQTACEKLSETMSDEDARIVEAEVGAWFQRWASWGWILDVEAA
jgi:hypothetical protein